MDVGIARDPHDVAELRWAWARESLRELPERPDVGFVAAVAGWMSDRARTVWTADDDGPQGMVCLTEYTRMPSPADSAGGRWGYLGHLYVVHTARGAGVGELLVRTVLHAAVDRGHRKVVLSPSPRSVPLYERCGFTGDNDLMTWRS